MTTEADWLEYLLTPDMITYGCAIGGLRVANTILWGTPGKGGQAAGLNEGHHIAGAISELAAADYFKVTPTGLYDRRRRDLADYGEVRVTEHRNGHLIIAHDVAEDRVDHDDAPFVMCWINGRERRVWFTGWMYGWEAKRIGDPNRQAHRFWVPFCKLHPMQEPFLWRNP